jgi:hypothetical protein
LKLYTEFGQLHELRHFAGQHLYVTMGCRLGLSGHSLATRRG